MEYLIRRCLAIILSFGFVFYAGLPAFANTNTGAQDATKLSTDKQQQLLKDQLRLMSGLQELQTTLTSAQKKLPRWPELQPLHTILTELQDINNEYFLKVWLLRSGAKYVPEELLTKLEKFKSSISSLTSLPLDTKTKDRLNELLSSVSTGIDKEKGRQQKTTTASASSTTQAESKPKGPGDSTLSDQLRLMSGLQELYSTLSSAQTKLPSWPDAKPLNSFLSELLQINNDYFLKVWLLRSGPMYLPQDLLDKLEKLAVQFSNISSISFEERVKDRLTALLAQLPGQIEKEKEKKQKNSGSSSSAPSAPAAKSTAAQSSTHRGSAEQMQRDQLQLRGHLQDLQGLLTTAQTKLPRWPELQPLHTILTELQDINNEYFLKVWLLRSGAKYVPEELLTKLEKFKSSISSLTSLPLDTKTKDRLNELLGQIPGEIDRERKRNPANSAQSQSQVQTTQTQKPKNVDARQLLNDQLRLMSGLQELQTTLTSAQKKLPRWPEVKPLDSVLSDLQKINNEYFLKVWLLRTGPMYVPQELLDKLKKLKTTIGEFSSLPFDPTTSRRVNDLLSSVSTGIEKEQKRQENTSNTRTKRAAPTPAAAPAAQVSARQSSASASGRRARRSLTDTPVQSRITQESHVAHPSARSVSAPSTRAAATAPSAPAAAAKPRKKRSVQLAHAATSAPKPRTKRSVQSAPTPAPKTSALAGLFAHLPLNIPPLQLPKLTLPPIQLPKITLPPLPKITLPPIPPLKIEWPPAPKIPPIKWPW